MRKKYYVCSGTLRVVLLSESPLLAAMDAMQNHSNGDTLDRHFVYVDERGFRSKQDALYWISINEVMEAINSED